MAGIRRLPFFGLALTASCVAGWEMACFCPPHKHHDQAHAVPYQNNSDKFVPVFASMPPGEGRTIEVAIVVLHGAPREAELYYEDMKRVVAGNGKTDSTLVIAPTLMDKACSAEQWLQGSSRRRSGKTAPYWSNSVSRWVLGGPASDGSGLTSYEALDSIFPWIQKHYRGVKKITVTGFSAGGQFISRWGTMTAEGQHGKSLGGIPMTIIVGSPSSVAYLTPERPARSCSRLERTQLTHKCTDYRVPSMSDKESAKTCGGKWNSWGTGTGGSIATDRDPSKINGAVGEYLDEQSGLTMQKDKLCDDILQRFATKDIRFLFGVNDNLSCKRGGCSADCEDRAQGRNRLQRGLNYMGHLQRVLPGNYKPVYGIYQAGHYHFAAYSSEQFAAWAWQEPAHQHYKNLASVAASEGKSVGNKDSHYFSIHECEVICTGTPGCNSFAYNPKAGACHLKDKCINASTPTVSKDSDYTTYYRDACTAGGGASEQTVTKTSGLGDSNWAETKRVVRNEGDELKAYGDGKYTVAQCKKFCDDMQGCKSFSYGTKDKKCYMKSACIQATDPIVTEWESNAAFKTYYRTTCGGGATRLFMATSPIMHEVPISSFGFTAFTLAGISFGVASLGFRICSARRAEHAAVDPDVERLITEASVE